MAERIRRALKHAPPENIIVAPDCGMKYLPRDVADGKLARHGRRRPHRAPGIRQQVLIASVDSRKHSGGRPEITECTPERFGADMRCRGNGHRRARPCRRGPALEEVVVTARKRDESFRDVPMSVNVFTEQAILSAGIQKPADFIARVPNMTLVETQNAGNAFVVVRGVSQARNSEASVAVLVDGVLETNPAEFNKELFDIRQIEVLKGPQGALYGRNAIGGAILIRTKDPSDELSGVFRGGFGNGSSKRAQAALSGPVGSSDTLKFRASLSYSDTDGFLNNTYLNEKADPSEELSGRARLVWKPSENFTGDLRFAFSNLDTRALYFVIPRDVEANPFSSFTTPPNANDVTSPIQARQPGREHARPVHRVAEDRFRDRARHADFRVGLQQHQGSADRRCLRLPSGRQLGVQRAGRLGPEPEPVPEPQEPEPGAAAHLRHRRHGVVDRRRLLRAHQALHLDRQHGGHRRRRVPRCIATPRLSRQQSQRHLPGGLAEQRCLGRVRQRDGRAVGRTCSSTPRCATTATSA